MDNKLTLREVYPYIGVSGSQPIRLDIRREVCTYEDSENTVIILNKDCFDVFLSDQLLDAPVRFLGVDESVGITIEVSIPAPVMDRLYANDQVVEELPRPSEPRDVCVAAEEGSSWELQPGPDGVVERGDEL